MTYQALIDRADALRPNPFKNSEKLRWLLELDGKISADIFNNPDFEIPEIPELSEAQAKASVPAVTQFTPLLEERHADIYLFYLCAMIDFFSRSYGEYNNSITLFNSAYDKMAKLKHAEKTPAAEPYHSNIF